MAPPCANVQVVRLEGGALHEPFPLTSSNFVRRIGRTRSLAIVRTLSKKRKLGLVRGYAAAECLALLCVLAVACRAGPGDPALREGTARTEAAIPGSSPKTVDWFTDRAMETGLQFVHFNGMSGEFYYPEIMAPGVGLLDYDNDGDLDVYIVQGQMLGDKASGQATFPPNAPLRDR